MPISDEVIELAPVKKTKKTLIIMISAIGVLFAAAVAFLVLYLVKPSVTENPTVVRGVSVTPNGFFSVVKDDEEINYASVGNEYTINSTIAVEKNTSPNINWRWEPHEALEIVDSKEDGEDPHITFRPRMGFDGREVTITAQSRADVNKSDTYKFTIVNQGTEQITVASYGSSPTNQKDVTDSASLTVDVPYYSLSTLQKHNEVYLYFNQYGAFYNGEYAPRTLYEDKKTGNSTHDVIVTVTKNANLIQISGVNTSKTGGRDVLQFTVKGSGEAEIKIDANVHNNTTGIDGNNVDVKIVSKTFKVNIQTNAQLDYVDSIYVLDKPVVDGEFIKSSLDNNKTSIDRTKLIAKATEEGAKLSTEKGVTLTLPYNATYYDIFKHIVLNPVKIQYVNEDGSFRENWYKNLDIKSSDDKTVKVTTDKDGNVSLDTLALANNVTGAHTCTLTITDKKAGGLGIEEKINVRIIAQNTEMTYSVSNAANNTVVEDVKKPGIISIDAIPDAIYTVTLEYTFKAPKLEAASELMDKEYINNVIIPSFEKSQLSVIEVVNNKEVSIAPSTAYKASTFKIGNPVGTNSLSTYKATLELTVKIAKDVKSGVVALDITKPGTVLGDESEKINTLDLSFTKRIEFNITVAATGARLVDSETGTDIVTQGHTKGGKYEVASSGDKITVYVQKENATTTLALTDSNSKWFVKNLITAEPAGADFIVNLTFTSSLGFRDDNSVFKFKTDADIKLNNYGISNSVMGNFTVKVSDLAKNEIASFSVDIYIIDVAVKLVTNPELVNQTVQYSAIPSSANNEYYTIGNNAVQIVRENITTPVAYGQYSGVKIYYGEMESSLTPLKTDDGITFYYESNGVKTNLYSYNSGSKRIIPLTDIYAVSYKNKINFSHIFVEFMLGSDEFIGKNKTEPDEFDATCFIPIIFERRVDGVALYETSSYEKELTKNSGGVYEYYVNQQQPGMIYSTPIILVDGERVPAYSLAGRIAAVRPSRIFVPAGFALNNTGAGNYYEYLDFTAPTVNSAEGVDRLSGFWVEATYNTAIKTNLIIVVQNEMRGISSIEFYKDDALTSKYSASEILLFGAYNNVMALTRDVYVKVSYEDYIEAYTSFESALISLPSYLSLTDPEKRITAVEGSTGSYKFLPDSNDLKDKRQGYYTSFKCTLTFSGTGEHNGDKFTVCQQNNPSSRAEASCGISVGTGLQNVIVTGEGFDERAIGGKQAVTATYTFNLTNTSDKPSLVLNLDYEAIIAASYGIKFNHKSVDKFNAAYTCADTTVLSVAVRAQADKPTVTISVNTVKSVSTPIRVTITFTDSSDGTPTQFVLNLDITINVDIFALGFEQAGGSYTVTTTGGATGMKDTPVTVKYNNGTADYQPLQSVKDKVVVYVAQLADGEYSKLVSNDVYVDGGKLYVSNSLTEASNLFVVAEYKISEDNVVRSEYRPIIVNTNANSIRLAQAAGDVKVKDGVANVTIEDRDSEFSLTAEAYNLTSKGKVTGTINYGLYTSRSCDVASSQATINADGKITFTLTAEPSGTVYYRAWFVDNGENCSGKTSDVIVEINYDVAVTSVELENIDQYTFSDGTINLYFQNSTSYTYIDLADYIFAYSSFQTGMLKDKPITKSVAEVGAYRILSVTGSTCIRPTKLGETTLNVTVEYNGSECSREFRVVVRSIGGIDLGASSGEIDAITNNTLTITPVITSVNGFNSAYTLTYNGGNLTVSGAGNTKTISLASQQNSTVGDYTVKAAVRYTPSDGSSAKIEGTIIHSIDYIVKVVCNYTPDFELKNGDNVISAYDGTDATKYAISDSAKEYTLSVSNTVTNAEYSFAKNNNIVTLSGNKVTVAKDSSGEVTITLTATLYGKTFTVSKNYYFAYGAEPVCSLAYSTNGTSFSDMPATLAVDYTTQKVQIKYVIAGVDTATVAPTDVSVIYNGNVTMGAVTASEDGKGYFVIFTVNGDCEFTVGGTVKVGARTVYLTTKTATLTATAPAFTLSASKTTLSSADGNNTATISASVNSGFKGDYSIVGLTIVEGSLLANVAGNTVTVGNSVEAGGKVVVRAQISVSNGLFVGTYYEQIELTVNGIAKPTVAWNSSVDKTLAVGGTSTYRHTLTSPTGYDYTGRVSTVTAANGNGLTEGTDYTFEGGVLTIKNTDKAKAGGKITLTVTVTVTSGAHNGLVVSDSVDVVVLPQLNNTDVTLANAIGEYDFGTIDNVKPYFGTHDGAITAGDGFAVKSLAINSGSASDAFGVSGSKLLIKQNILSASTTLSLTVTVEMLDGEYKGQRISGEISVGFEVPESTTVSVVWNDSTNAYDSLALSAIATLPSTPRSASVALLGDVSDGVYINNNGTANPTVAIAKTFNMGFAGDSTATKSVLLGLTVKCENEKVYYTTVTLNVSPVAVNVTQTIDGSPVGTSYDCMSGDTFVLTYTATNGFAVTITSVTGATDPLNASRVGSDILFNADIVSGDIDRPVTVNYTVGALTGSHTITISIKAPLSSDPFKLSNGEITDVASGELKTVNSTATVSTSYYYMSSIRISAPRNLSTYFTSIKYGSSSPTTGTSLNNTTLTLAANSSHDSIVSSFNLTLVINTANQIPATEITVTYVGYNGRGWTARSTTYTAVYKIQVVGDVIVTLDANGGRISGSTSTTVSEKYKDAYKNLIDPTRTGYTFDGWYDSAVGGDKVENGGTQKVGKEAHTLYAHWNVNTYKVKYNENGGDPITDTKEDVKYGDTYGALKTNPTRDGHTFAGWYDSAEGGNIITSDTVVNSSKASGSELTLYAHWTKNVYTVTLVYDNGTGSTYPIKVEYDDVFNLHLAITPTYANHEFLGWFDSTNTQQTAPITVKGDVTLTAHWKTVYTVTFNNGGDVTTATYDAGATYGSNVTAFKILADTDTHKFVGWSNIATATTAAQCVTGTDTVTSTHTLYAIWQEVYTVTFNNGGAITTVKYDDGAAYNTNAAFTTLENTDTQTFVGWSTNPYETDSDKCVKGTDTVTSAHTLYAIWKDKEVIGD